MFLKLKIMCEPPLCVKNVSKVILKENFKNIVEYEFAKTIIML